MTKITVDKDLIEQALSALEMGLRFREAGLGRPPEQYNPPAIEALRAALAEPAVEPDRYVWEEYDRYSHGWGWSENTTPYDPRSAEKKQYHSCTDFNNPEKVRNFRVLYTSPPPAEVPMLTDEEVASEMHRALSSMSYSSEQAFMDGVRAGEKAVRQKAGLKS